ncbi:Glycolate dehydrogenase, iron-sulfur subunit GlcF [Caballeronia glathei]|jgi:glycolate oxidase iron-sulfur subunit|uniref:Glycolate oxidase iron-sulfur subunit n=1 Tax=Caballeronia glathei TaxID=60547 RepID=A0A069PWJ2_9BURK|nr:MULTISPECIES: glycolate oxidase subunit GlcF [Burkholderiaceae]KDR44184.1 glycolate oxidase iron-sulfur subunit [Caballeronia glathei]TCK34667.1 glycolate oxidase iron-sulfur subunit [Paraburkholderia sp. BL8N3]CDY77461.1 Glycolate dehydrogenase, iron-sulfur subunit GlcF [Caballeronia glathei]
MQTNLSEHARTLPRADEAESILRSCVHCGFCNATCPTYQILGNELDGPRGRIYLIKQLLEGEPVTAKTQLHLDRCLTCRNCETTCPSGVTYHALLDIGRAELERRVERPASERLLREGLRRVIPHPAVFDALLKTGRAVSPFLPDAIRRKIPKRAIAPKARPAPRHARRVLMLEGCVQPSLSPNTNAAAARVLDRLGISVSGAPQAGCCGATDYHLNAQEAGLARARRNIDAWWPAVEAGAEAIVQTASGCGAFVKEYGHLLRDDPAYAARAERISAMTRDLVEVLAAEPLDALRAAAGRRIAFHCPCTLQHAQKLGGAVEGVLQRLGFDLTSVPDAHLCCGSAGTYSITQPALAESLRKNKLDALESGRPEVIATANIGCQTHLDGAGRTAVRHWIELVEEALP